MTQHLIIIGAPRSGTNMLRDVLTALPGFVTWPCDEINFVWRHGNRQEPSDELTPEMARPRVRAYLRHQFTKIAMQHDARFVVEKTCANSLRPEFVTTSFPDAKYLFIYRHGIDAAASAMARWHAPLDWRYTLAKARFVPPSDVPYYTVQFVRNRLRGLRTPSAKNAAVESWWGPKTRDMEALQAHHPLDELCMIQWKRCVDAARRGLPLDDADRVHEIAYEEFVVHPIEQLQRILQFLGASEAFDPTAVARVSSSSVGKGRADLDSKAARRMESVAGDTLNELGYV